MQPVVQPLVRSAAQLRSSNSKPNRIKFSELWRLASSARASLFPNRSLSAIPAGNAGGSRFFSFSFESAAGCTRGSQRQQACRSAVLSFLFFRFEFSCAFAVDRLDWLAPFSCAPRPPSVVVPVGYSTHTGGSFFDTSDYHHVERRDQIWTVFSLSKAIRRKRCIW